MRGKVKSAKLIEQGAEGELDLILLTIGIEQCYAFDKFEEVNASLIGETVDYDCIPGKLPNGKDGLIVTEITLQKQVNVVEQKHLGDFKLVSSTEVLSSQISHSFSRFKVGDYYKDVRILVMGGEFKESEKACWVDLSIYDRDTKKFIAKVFLPRTNELNSEAAQELINEVKGTYIIADVECSKYGYTLHNIVQTGKVVEQLPDTVLAKKFISDYIKIDKDLMDYVSRFNFLDEMASKIIGLPGYELIEIAFDIVTLDNLKRFALDLPEKALLRAIICSRGYLLNEIKFGKTTDNFLKINKINSLVKDQDLLKIIRADVDDRNEPILQYWYYICHARELFFNIKYGNFEIKLPENILDRMR